MMGTDYELQSLAREINAERVREAEQARLFLRAKKAGGSSPVFRSLLAVLAYLPASITRLGRLRALRGLFLARGANAYD